MDEAGGGGHGVFGEGTLDYVEGFVCCEVCYSGGGFEEHGGVALGEVGAAGVVGVRFALVSGSGVVTGAVYSSSRSSIAPSMASGAVMQLFAPRSLIRRVLSAW